ncbi:hypothetical protein ElyMa_001417100 [Elysia marginata]|uniref:Uncharacterized protein n=1 Tax=Elysia marginata TaxID=1093978 RepID=A0AAV4IYS9_9GAST|nr:hypothetical protein ElyMa_001417100 [Elysia marginata]
MKRDVNQLKEERSMLVDELEVVRKLVTVARVELNELNQYSRRCNVRVFRVRDNSSERREKSTELVRSIIKNKLKLNLADSDIDKARPLGKFRASADRAIRVRFNSHSTAEQVLFKRRALEGTGITIAEDLTKSRTLKK